MADLIDRAAAYDAIGFERCDRSCADCPTKCTWFYTVRNIPAVNRWISCSERLPEVYEKVLTYNDEGIIHDNFRLNLRDGSVGWSQGWGITHWQPRPEPPKEGAER